MDYNRLERSESKRIGAKVHKNSGRGKVKGDADNDHFVIDYKFASKSFTINGAVWGKICSDAMKHDKNKSPMLYLVLGEGNKTVRLAVVEYSTIEEILGEQ